MRSGAGFTAGRAGLQLLRLKSRKFFDEVNSWTTFTRHFSHIKMTLPVPIPTALTTILADGINLPDQNGEACPGAPNHHSKIFRHGTSVTLIQPLLQSW
jgi:hypothetical protein